MLVDLQSALYLFWVMVICTLVAYSLNTCPSSGFYEPAQVWGFYSFALICLSLFLPVFFSASSATSVVLVVVFWGLSALLLAVNSWLPFRLRSLVIGLVCLCSSGDLSKLW